jgi:hypothetical protein
MRFMKIAGAFVDLSGRVEGIYYTITYGIGEGPEEEADN